jgi:hypothetical protein
MGMGIKKDESSTECLGCWILPFYSLFSLIARFETYKPIISLIGGGASVNRG